MLADKFRLDGKVAIVAGAGKGIGQCIGLAFAEAGANVVFAARTECDIQANAEKARAFGIKSMAVPCDVKDDKQLQALAEKTMQAFGKIDILVNVAGGATPNPIQKTNRMRFNEAFDFNVTCAFSLTRICLPHLKASKGCVINITSAAGRVIQPNYSAYGSVKAALNFLTRLMASELAPDVRVNAIAPGAITTDALTGYLDPASLEKMAELTPMKRLGEPLDIALGALYLASPAARCVTGKILEIDGGMEKTNVPS